MEDREGRGRGGGRQGRVCPSELLCVAASPWEAESPQLFSLLVKGLGLPWPRDTRGAVQGGKQLTASCSLSPHEAALGVFHLGATVLTPGEHGAGCRAASGSKKWSSASCCDLNLVSPLQQHKAW